MATDRNTGQGCVAFDLAVAGRISKLPCRRARLKILILNQVCLRCTGKHKAAKAKPADKKYTPQPRREDRSSYQRNRIFQVNFKTVHICFAPVVTGLWLSGVISSRSQLYCPESGARLCWEMGYFFRSAAPQPIVGARRKTATGTCGF